MLASELYFLKGKRIRAARKVHDYLQLIFFDGDVLNIYNDYYVESRMHCNIEDVIDCDILSTHRLEMEEKLELPGASITIRMSDDAFHGPEAMEYIGTSGHRMIFS